MAKTSRSKRRKLITKELNRLFKSMPQFFEYSILNEQCKLMLCKNNNNAISYTKELTEIGSIINVRHDNPDLTTYQTTDAQKQVIAKLIVKYERDILEKEKQHRQIENIVNNQLNNGYFKIINDNKAQLVITDKTCQLQININQLNQHVKNNNTSDAMLLIVKACERQQIDISLFLKATIDKNYQNKALQIIKNDTIQQKISTTIDQHRMLLTEDVRDFIKQFQNKKQKNCKITNIAPKQSKINTKQHNCYVITFNIGNIYKATFTSNSSNPYVPEITINEKEYVNLTNEIIFIKKLTIEKLSFCKKYREMQKQHDDAIKNIIIKKKAGKYGESIVKQAQHPELTLGSEPEYNLEYTYKNGKEIILNLENDDQMASWLMTCQKNFKQTEQAVESKISNAIKNIDAQLTDPLNRAILMLIRDTNNKGAKSLIDILKGSKCAAVLANKYDKHPSYGKLKDYKREIIEDMIDNLVRMDLIESESYVNKYDVYCTAYQLSEKTILQLSVTPDTTPETTIDNSTITLKQCLTHLRSLKQITIEHLIPSLNTIESDKSVQQIITFMKTAKCASDAEDALALYFADAIPPKLAPLFMLNSQMETGKTSKRLKNIAELLQIKAGDKQ